jgi:hypothetical protein
MWIFPHYLSYAYIHYFCLIQRIFSKNAFTQQSVTMYWLVTTAQRENGIYIILDLKMLCNNCSFVLGLWSLNCPLLGPNCLPLGRKTQAAWGHPVKGKQRRWIGPGAHSFLRQPSLPRPRYSLTTAQAASWGGKAGSLWCIQRPRCRSSSSRLSLCTSAAPAALGPATHR